MKKVKAVGAVFLSALLVLGMAGNASATEPAPPASLDGNSSSVLIPEVQPGSTSTVQLSDDTSVTLSLGIPKAVTVADVVADSSLSAVQKVDIINQIIAKPTAIMSNHYSQFTNGAPAYVYTHNGTFYYNGTRAWVTTSYSGYQGSHSCFVNYAVVSITTKQCSESGGVAYRDMYAMWEVNLVGIVYSYSMTARVHASGTVSGTGATVGW